MVWPLTTNMYIPVQKLFTVVIPNMCYTITSWCVNYLSHIYSYVRAKPIQVEFLFLCRSVNAPPSFPAFTGIGWRVSHMSTLISAVTQMA